MSCLRGRYNSVLEPNFIIPNCSPPEKSCPDWAMQTILLAMAPDIWRTRSLSQGSSSRVIVFFASVSIYFAVMLRRPVGILGPASRAYPDKFHPAVGNLIPGALQYLPIAPGHCRAGLKIIDCLLEQEVEQRCGPRGRQSADNASEVGGRRLTQRAVTLLPALTTFPFILPKSPRRALGPMFTLAATVPGLYLAPHLRQLMHHEFCAAATNSRASFILQSYASLNAAQKPFVITRIGNSSRSSQ